MPVKTSLPCVLYHRVSFLGRSTECRVTSNKAAPLGQLEWEDRVHDGLPPTKDMDDMLAVGVDAEDDLDLQDILPPGAVDVQSSLRGFLRRSNRMPIVRF